MEKLGSPEPAHPSPGAGPVAGVSADKSAGTEGDEAAAAAVGSKLFHCACLRRWLPQAYREELYHVFRLTGPLVVSRLLNFLLTFVNGIFCGHIGNAELAGYALASATINVTTSATGFGLALACDTLISQTFGSKNLKRVGVILQRSSLILVLFCLPCWALLLNSHNLLLMLHQENEVARIAHLYLMVFLPAVPAMFLHHLQVSYLQNQGIILPQMYTAAAANLLNLGFNYVLISRLELGVLGSAIANSLSQITMCLLLFGYIRWKKLHQQTWGGWTTECLQEWGAYMKLAIPSAFMICFEWWVWEIGGFLAGILGEVDLAAQHILAEIGNLIFMIPLGVQTAACVRVGNALGAGNTTQALLTRKLTLFLSGFLAVIQGIVIFGTRTVSAYMFTSDPKVVELVSESLIVYTFLQFSDTFLCVSAGILVGAGMQKVAALTNLVAYYGVCVPLAVALMFYAHLSILGPCALQMFPSSTAPDSNEWVVIKLCRNLKITNLFESGFWLGLLVCVYCQTTVFLILLFRLDWKKVTRKAQLRAGKKTMMTLKRPASMVLSEAMVPDISDCPNTAQMDSEEAPKADGYHQVNTQDMELKALHEAKGNNAAAGATEGDAEQSKNTSNTKPQELLSVTQLILRRGFTFLVAVLILVIGIVLHIAFPVPESSMHSRDNFTLNWANESTPTPLTPLDLTSNL